MPSRSRRLIRLRCGALPSFPGTMSPMRSAKGEVAPHGLATARIRPNFPSNFCPRRSAWNSAERVKRPSSSSPCGFAALAMLDAISLRPSGGELLAAARAPRRDDLAAAHRAPCEPGNHAGACGRACSADRCVSRDELQADGREFENRGLGDRLSRSGGLSERKIAALTERRAYARRIRESQRFGLIRAPIRATVASGRKRPDSEKVFNVTRMFRWALSSPRTRAFLRATASCKVALMRRLQSAPSCEVRDNLPIEPDCHQLLRRLFLPSPPPAFPQIIHRLSPSNYPTALKRRPLLRLGFVSSK